MAKIVCKKCGATGYSKCPYCRTEFMDNQVDAVLSNVLKHSIKTNENGTSFLEVKYIVPSDWTEEVSFTHLYDVLKNIIEGKEGYPDLKMFCCNHEMEFAPGEVSSIGCGHTN